MKKQSLFLFVTLVAFTAFFVSCKKKSEPQSNSIPKPLPVQCRITTVEYVNILNQGFREHIEYNSGNKISAIIDSEHHQRTDFIYRGNKIYITLSTDTGAVEFDTVTLNIAGLVDTVATHFWGYTNYSTMNYDANNQLIYENLGYSSANYIWKDGNPIAINGGGSSTDSIKYDLSKKAMDGDYFWLDNLKWGARTIKNSNLVTRFLNSSLKYNIDTSGKITGMVILDPSGATQYYYSYNCD